MLYCSTYHPSFCETLSYFRYNICKFVLLCWNVHETVFSSSIYILCIFLSPSPIFFFSAGYLTQDLIHARQTLYHWAVPPAPFHFIQSSLSSPVLQVLPGPGLWEVCRRLIRRINGRTKGCFAVFTPLDISWQVLPSPSTVQLPSQRPPKSVYLLPSPFISANISL
jgi:hypothetical protein